MEIDQEVYFGVIPGCLDIFTLSYRCFGCTWVVRGSVRKITGYWFADSQDEVKAKAGKAGQLTGMRLARCADVKEMYDEIRRQQALQDWGKRSRLSIKLILKDPWRSVKPGWYVLRSREPYPNYVSAIRKGRWFAWIEHVAVCETEQDLHSFISAVNTEHRIQLTVLKNV